MALDLTLLRLFVAQAQSSNIADFVGQISGLVALTCGAGLIWIALMAFIFQRGAERRRRAAQGLEPLPPIYTSLWQTLTGKRPARPASQPVVGPVVPPAPMPDLALLTGDVPLTEAAPAPAPIPSAQPEPETDMAPTPASQPGPPNSPADASAAPPEADEVLRVWRDRDTGALIVEIDGYRFLASEPPRGSDLERRFAALLRDLGAACRVRTRPLRPPSARLRVAAPRCGRSGGSRWGSPSSSRPRPASAPLRNRSRICCRNGWRVCRSSTAGRFMCGPRCRVGSTSW